MASSGPAKNEGQVRPGGLHSRVAAVSGTVYAGGGSSGAGPGGGPAFKLAKSSERCCPFHCVSDAGPRALVPVPTDSDLPPAGN